MICINTSSLLVNIECWSDEDQLFWKGIHASLQTTGSSIYVTNNNGLPISMGVPTLPSPASFGRHLKMSSGDPALTDSEVNELVDLGVKWGRSYWSPDYIKKTFGGYYLYLQVIKPSLVVIWNHYWPPGRILIKLCCYFGIEYRIAERSPWPKLLSLDKSGSLIDTQAYQSLKMHVSSAIAVTNTYSGTAQRYVESILHSSSWWKQPASLGVEKIREKFNLPRNKSIVVFAGQVDDDIQNYLHSPFSSNIHALSCFMDSLPKDIFILGKHHPMSRLSPQNYQAVLGNRGIWTDELSLNDAFQISDHFAAVNSALLFEASLHGKRCMSLGKTMLSGCSVFHEWNSLSDRETTLSWLNDSIENTDLRRKQHLHCLGYLIENHLYSIADSFARSPDTPDYAHFAADLVEASRPAEKSEVLDDLSSFRYCAFVHSIEKSLNLQSIEKANIPTLLRFLTIRLKDYCISTSKKSLKLIFPAKFLKWARSFVCNE